MCTDEDVGVRVGSDADSEIWDWTRLLTTIDNISELGWSRHLSALRGWNQH